MFGICKSIDGDLLQLCTHTVCHTHTHNVYMLTSNLTKYKSPASHHFNITVE